MKESKCEYKFHGLTTWSHGIEFNYCTACKKVWQDASLPSSSVTGEEDKEDFALLDEYDLKWTAEKTVNHVFDKVPEDNKRQFLINFINGMVGSAILHHHNRYVKKINVPDFKTTFK